EPRLDLAIGRAAVAAHVVSVVAGLVDDQAVPAPGRAAAAGLARRLVLALGRAAVERERIAVVAALGPLDHLVAAGGVAALAGAAAALPARLELAGRRAAVTGRGVPVVAQLGDHGDSVSAARHPVTGLPLRDAHVSRIDAEAIRRAAVAGHR